MSAGKIIKFLRQKHGLTQNELSEILGVTKNSIQKYESDHVPNIKVETMRTLCDRFDIPPRALLFPEEFRGRDIDKSIKLEKIMKHYAEKELMYINDEGLRKIFDYIKDISDSGNYEVSQDQVNLSQDKNI